jgi:chromosome partitioning protein
VQLSIGEIVTIAHSKGGAGKTSLTFNLGFALADTGASVLVIDLDTQTGQSAFLSEPGSAAADVGSVLLGHHHPDEAVIVDVYPNLDVMPAEERSISEAWQRLHTADGRTALADLFDHARRHWDIVLVDTPGHQSVGLATTLSLSDGVIIPMPPEAGPVSELPTILNAISASATQGGRPEVYGIVRTRVWGNSVYRRVAEDQIRVIADQYGVPLFKHKVPEDAKFGEAHLIGLPVGAYHPRARSAVAYRYVAYELIERRGWPFAVGGSDVMEPT